MSVCEVRVHLEPVDGGEIAWWADSEQLPGLSATARTLPELLDLTREALVELGVDLETVWFGLVEVAEDELTAGAAPSILTGQVAAKVESAPEPPARTRLETILVA